jgi:stearoyl-CoA desaturase (delta-9 desaturase)
VQTRLLGALTDMNSAPLKKAPINWIAIFALVFLPIVALITIPIYSYHHDFSMGAWISMFFYWL